MATKPKLDTDLSGESVDQTDYHSKIESLMYLPSSRPDIVQAVCYYARYQARPTEKHLKEMSTMPDALILAKALLEEYKFTSDKDSYKDGDGDASFQLKSDSLPHAHAQTTRHIRSIKNSRIK
ncbi:hypothetical protein Tco_0908662 [Tanacetum coccineum]|uniref:Uncharacterized protein n=1 Tax=Tanacetum coccineum TaxID=301880 RepID=A0ABQ5CPW7_9ASTR